jgi:hypothetical protein
MENGPRPVLWNGINSEQVEMVEPRKALDRAGTETIFVSPKDESVHALEMD